MLAHGAVAAQTVSPRTPIRLDADAARFAGSDSLAYLEVYYGISEGCLTYGTVPGGYRGAVEMRITVADSVRTIATRDWVLPRLIADTAGLRSPQNILSYESLGLPEGSYRLTLSARDSIDPARADSVAIALRVSPVAGRTALSDIELCSRITPSADRSSPFYKNTLEAIPNPARLFGEGLPVVHFYVEVYNLDREPGPPAVLRASIRDSRGQEVVSQAKPKPRTSSSSVEFGSMNIQSLPGGSYVLRIAIEDTTSIPARTIVSSERKFFVYNPGVAPAPDPGPESRYERMFAVTTEEEADDEIRKLRYIATDRERRLAEELSGVEAKRKFLGAFWTDRSGAVSPDGGDPRESYLRKLREADREFDERSIPGWLTDRGRVWILYGPPDNIDRHPSAPESRPYQTWEYNAIQGGVVFIFVDRTGFGSYRLVHSTHLNELRNDDWYQQEAVIR